MEWFTKRFYKSVSDASNCNIQKEPSEEPIYKPFRLPITYLSSQSLQCSLVTDLELDTVMYDTLFQPSHSWGSQLIPEWSKQFSTDIEYLCDTQDIIKSISDYQEQMKLETTINCKTFHECWDEFHMQHFLEKYNYIEWDVLKHMNESSLFLQLLSIGNILSPVISLLVPILFLIIPFFILKFKGIPITLDVYVQILQDIAKNHFIGKAIAGVQSMSMDKLVSVFIMFGLYLMQIYQNITICLRFYDNTKNLNRRLLDLRSYVRYSIVSMKTFLRLNSDKASYTSFMDDVRKRLAVLEDLYQWLMHVSTFEFGLRKGAELGYMLRVNYELWKNQDYQDALRYSVGFEGYIDNLRGLHNHWKAGHIAFAVFGDDTHDTTDAESESDEVETHHHTSSIFFKEQYYPVLLKNDHDRTTIVKNNLNMKRNMIITGPNASGKTTYLKTTALNLIFTQQFGAGFYSAGKVPKLYTHIHSYLNIPDTSERDSLFQAEARRCKVILDAIDRDTDHDYHHFCIFDELYSGTNPKEASRAAYAFLKYLSGKSNTQFLLTTHYVDMCKRFQNSRRVTNYQMLVEMLDGRMKYTYRIDTGISKVEGAMRILEDMNYPQEIIGILRH